MYTSFLVLLVLCSFASAELPMMNYADPQKIGVQNSILAKVNGTTISMMDVKKKMDLAFYQNFPHLADSNQARFQFYENSWRRVLTEMIDNELILADAADREIKLTDAEVREEMETRFGPSVMSTLDQIGLTYDEAWKMLKNDMIVQRMSWWFIQAKAMAEVTPQDIRQSYRLYIKEHPAFTEWKYRVLSIRGIDSAQAAQDLYQHIQTTHLGLDQIPDLIKQWETTSVISLSPEYTASDDDLSESHQASLSALEPGSFGPPNLQASRDRQKLYRIFYLSEKLQHPAPTFDEMAPQLKNELLQKHSLTISQAYLEKLRKHYRFDANQSIPPDFKPFAIQ